MLLISGDFDVVKRGQGRRASVQAGGRIAGARAGGRADGRTVRQGRRAAGGRGKIVNNLVRGLEVGRTSGLMVLTVGRASWRHQVWKSELI